MERIADRKELIAKLQNEILSIQGFHTSMEGQQVHFGWGDIEQAFPNKIFPQGAIHELISNTLEDMAATTGFMAALAGRMMQKGGLVFWISKAKMVFPPALKQFGVDPDKVIFITVKNQKNLLWMIEQALKCPALTAVVGEITELSLVESRRLQLAVEQSQVTGLLHRILPRTIANTASVARWKITSLANDVTDELPGLRFGRWNVELIKIRNGRPGKWQVQWSAGKFEHLTTPAHKTATRLSHIA